MISVFLCPSASAPSPARFTVTPLFKLHVRLDFAFSDLYFDGLDVQPLHIGGKLSPKILIVKPESRLSWQYHNRRAEIWQIFQGSAGIVRSDNDTETEMKVYDEGDQIVLKQGERHRLIGLDNHCVVAEIWQHTDKNNPSDEDDIIRVQDDFGR